MRTEKGLTKKFVDKLKHEFRVSLYRVAKECKVSYTNAKNWRDGKYEAHPLHLAILQDLYNEQCKLHGVGLYSPIRTYETFKELLIVVLVGFARSISMLSVVL